MSVNSFNSRSTLKVGSKEYEIYRLDALDKQGISTKHLPFSLRILLENLLRTEDGRNVTKEEVRALARWNSKSKPDKEIAFTPSRVLLQDFTGVPCVVDLAAMRDAMQTLGGDPALINPLQPVELVIDHSVQVDEFGTPNAFEMNALLEFQRNKERYSFLRWGQTGFRNLAIVPPDTGIVHQVNLEYLARVVFVHESAGKRTAYPDTLVGTDSHTTMVNGLGVLGWGVGGIEAEAAMLGQPVSMLIPLVVGVKLTGRLREGATATDLVLTVTEMLRKHGVVGKFVEYFGPGLHDLSLADRATIANMSPEYGATCGIFPIDKETLKYLRLTGRSEEQIALVEAYSREQGLFHDEKTAEAEYSELLALDLATVEPSLAGPKRPQDRVVLSQAGESFQKALPSLLKPKTAAKTAAASASCRSATTRTWEQEGGNPAAIGVEDPNVHEHVPASVKDSLKHGSVVIAAITSCTNTSNPSVLIAAGLLAKKAVEKGLSVPAWVKTSLAPGSKVVTDYLAKAGLTPYLEKLKFHLVGYGCTTCIGNSGPLPTEVSQAIDDKELVVASVLSGNRNFEGRINSEVRANYLMSPPLVVAFALAGRIDIDLRKDAIGKGRDGQPVYLADIWPSQREIEESMQHSITSEMFSEVLRRRVSGRRTLARPLRAQGPDLFVGTRFHLHPPRSLLRRHVGEARACHRHQEGARAGRARRQRHHRPHLPRRIDQERQPRRKISAGARREARGLQLLRFAPRQSRSDGARHLRQRAPAQQTGRNRRRIHPPPADATPRCRSSTPRKNIARPARRSSFSPEKNTAPVHRATGPPKVRRCWACAP